MASCTAVQQRHRITATGILRDYKAASNQTRSLAMRSFTMPLPPCKTYKHCQPVPCVFTGLHPSQDFPISCYMAAALEIRVMSRGGQIRKRMKHSSRAANHWRTHFCCSMQAGCMVYVSDGCFSCTPSQQLLIVFHTAVDACTGSTVSICTMLDQVGEAIDSMCHITGMQRVMSTLTLKQVWSRGSQITMLMCCACCYGKLHSSSTAA